MAGDKGTPVPDAKTLWQAQGGELTPQSPVNLSWDNGQGLVFTRTISADEEYLFTIRQDVENRTNAPVTLYPYARIQRDGTPQVAGVYVLFEGLMLIVENGASSEMKLLVLLNRETTLAPGRAGLP